MSVDDIVKKIVDEARDKARSVAEDAAREAVRLRNRLDREEKEIREAAERAIEAETREIVARSASAARLEGRKRVLGQKEMIMGEVYGDAKERILALPEDQYLDFLKGLVLRHSAGGGETVILSPRDIARFKGRLPQWEKDTARALEERAMMGTISVSSATRDIEGGLIISQGGRTELNLSLGVIIDRIRYDIEKEVTDILFGRSLPQ